MPLFRRRKGPERWTLDELIAEAKAIVERARRQLGPDDDFVTSLLTDGRDGTEVHAFARPGEDLEKALAKVTRRAERFVLWRAAWQTAGERDRVEVVLLQAVEAALGREELWRARLERVPNRPPNLAAWERVDQPVPLD